MLITKFYVAKKSDQEKVLKSKGLPPKFNQSWLEYIRIKANLPLIYFQFLRVNLEERPCRAPLDYLCKGKLYLTAPRKKCFEDIQ